jgi:hypothetical protein
MWPEKPTKEHDLFLAAVRHAPIRRLVVDHVESIESLRVNSFANTRTGTSFFSSWPANFPPLNKTRDQQPVSVDPEAAAALATSSKRVPSSTIRKNMSEEPTPSSSMDLLNTANARVLGFVIAAALCHALSEQTRFAMSSSEPPWPSSQYGHQRLRCGSRQSVGDVDRTDFNAIAPRRDRQCRLLKPSTLGAT